MTTTEITHEQAITKGPEKGSDKVKANGTLYIISAPSGAGKTSLIKALLKQLKQLSLSTSHTTRERRATEQDGVDYFFTNVERFKQMVAENQFVEHACVFENYYGTSSAHIQDVLDLGCDLILEIDWQGAEQVKAQFHQSVSIFILPPSKNELYNRLNSRGLDSDDIINKRMLQAEQEISHHKNYDYILVNDEFSQALDELKSIICANRFLQRKQMINLSTLVQDLLA